jgi:hypothetical protein
LMLAVHWNTCDVVWSKLLDSHPRAVLCSQCLAQFTKGN